MRPECFLDGANGTDPAPTDVELRDYLRVLRRRKWIIVATVFIAAALAWGQAALATPLYRARTRVFIGQQALAPADIAQGLATVQLSQQLVESYAEIATSRPLLEEVADREATEGEAASLAGRISVTPVPNTLLIDLAVSDPDPEVAARLANAWASVFVEEITGLQSDGREPPVLRVRVIEPAAAPVAPVTPRPRLNLVLGILAGVVGGTLAALVIDHLDVRIKDPEDAQRVLDVPLLGTIPRFGRGTTGPVVGDSHSRDAEAMRIVRTNIRFAMLPRGAARILVSSPVAREGKTTVAANLALALAQAGDRVVLVDADLRRPKVAEFLGIPPGPGLTDVLLGEAQLKRSAISLEGGNLLVVPAGSRPPNPAELLASPQMAALVRLLADRADIVIFDSPPLLPVADSAILASLTDGEVMVLRHRVSTRHRAVEAREVLAKAGARTLGFVMNAVPARASGYDYSYPYRAPAASSNGAGRGLGRLLPLRRAERDDPRPGWRRVEGKVAKSQGVSGPHGMALGGAVKLANTDPAGGDALSVQVGDAVLEASVQPEPGDRGVEEGTEVTLRVQVRNTGRSAARRIRGVLKARCSSGNGESKDYWERSFQVDRLSPDDTHQVEFRITPRALWGEPATLEARASVEAEGTLPVQSDTTLMAVTPKP